MAGGWNDGSRLATVECLVDYHTLAIDESVYVRVPRIKPDSDEPFPYDLQYPDTWLFGTKDKIYVRGHFYSHKPPVPAMLLAPWYFVWQRLTGLTARSRCDEFCYWMTVGSSGLAYVIAVVCIHELGRVERLPLVWRLVLTSTFALSTVTVVYVQSVNDHILLLAVGAAIALLLASLSREVIVDGAPRRAAECPGAGKWLCLAGCLAGLGYTFDQATGPALLLATAAVIAYRVGWRAKMLAVFILAALPWLILHHVLNYAIGGTLKPIGSLPEYFDWPGTPFDRRNMTGFWNHPSIAAFLRYAGELLVLPSRGFLTHNLPLLAALPAAVTVWRRKPEVRPEVLWALAWCTMTWLVYSALSVNSSGECCSIRWFVPLLAAGYYPLAISLRDDPRYRVGLVIVGIVGAVLGAAMAVQGPWLEPESSSFANWQLAGVGLWAVWLAWAVWYGPPQPARPSAMAPRHAHAERAGNRPKTS